MYAASIRARVSFCSHCGVRFADPTAYPRTCAACGAQTWANPIPVAVVLLPVTDGVRTGLLVVRRAIPPVGRLALVGGFVEDHESWQMCATRELREEAGVVIDPTALHPLWYASSAPRPDRVLLFSLAPAVDASALPPFTPNAEASERGIYFGAPEGGGTGDDELGFPLHVEAARRYLCANGRERRRLRRPLTGPLSCAPRARHSCDRCGRGGTVPLDRLYCAS